MNRQQGQKRTVPSRVPLELLPMPDEAGVRPLGARTRPRGSPERVPHPHPAHDTRPPGG